MIPIPTTKPEQSQSIFSSIKDGARGLFSQGLDLVSTQIEHNRQLELLKLQQNAASQNTSTNSGETFGQDAPANAGIQTPLLASISPLAIGIFAVAGVLLLRK